MWTHVKRYRTVIWHAAYGLPCALMALVDGLRMVDTGALLGPFLPYEQVAFAGAFISLVSVVMHFFADTRPQSFRDDGTLPSDVRL